ncbi:MAG: thiolase domain-containing protein [Anaerolineales bacterium]|nr:thiolase domain-containing protein [Anaerolineales bacterium]
MTDVVIAGIGQTSVGEHWHISLRELAYQAIEAARKDAGGLLPQALFVGNMLAPTVSGQAHLGVLIADFADLRGIEAYTVEAAGASGGAALRAGYLAIKSGFVDVALVLGIEKLTDKVGPEVDSAIATSLDSDYEAVQGATPLTQAAMLMRRYFHEYDVPQSAFAGFPVTAHANGAGNPHAMFRKAIKPALYERVGMVCDPLNIFDAAPDADGAAAVLLTRSDLLPPDTPHSPIRVAGSSVATDTLSLHDRPDPLDFRSARLSVERACYQAGIAIDQVDFFELYDAYSIYAVLSLEAAGLAERGQGWVLAEEDQISLKGHIPISTLGGLKARGNPWGATGVYQVVEAVLQLRGDAGDNQIPEAKNALVQCLGGPASTAVTHVLMAQ